MTNQIETSATVNDAPDLWKQLDRKMQDIDCLVSMLENVDVDAWTEDQNGIVAHFATILRQQNAEANDLRARIEALIDQNKKLDD